MVALESLHIQLSDATAVTSENQQREPDLSPALGPETEVRSATGSG